MLEVTDDNASVISEVDFADPDEFDVEMENLDAEELDFLEAEAQEQSLKDEDLT